MPTLKEKIETIREACIKANPEIMELEFGCELKRPGSTRHYKVIEDLGWGANDKVVWVNSVPFGSMDMPRQVDKDEITDSNGEKWKILGRPIRLADVLVAIIKTPRWLGQRVEDQAKDFFNVTMYWIVNEPLKDSLTDQEEETIDFIYNLIR